MQGKGQTLSALSARQRADRVFELKIWADRVLGRIGFEGRQGSEEEGRTGQNRAPKAPAMFFET